MPYHFRSIRSRQLASDQVVARTGNQALAPRDGRCTWARSRATARPEWRDQCSSTMRTVVDPWGGTVTIAVSSSGQYAQLSCRRPNGVAMNQASTRSR